MVVLVLRYVGLRKEEREALATAVLISAERARAGGSVHEKGGGANIRETIDVADARALKALSFFEWVLWGNLIGVPAVGAGALLLSDWGVVGPTVLVYAVLGSVGIGFVLLGIGQWRRKTGSVLLERLASRERWGRSVLRPVPPIRVGGRLQAMVDTKIPATEVNHSTSFVVELARHSQVLYPEGRERRQKRRTVFRKRAEERGLVPEGETTIHVPVSFEIPEHQPPSSVERPEPRDGEPVEFPLWNVQVTGRGTAASYRAHFPVPVRAPEGSTENLTDGELETEEVPWDSEEIFEREGNAGGRAPVQRSTAPTTADPLDRYDANTRSEVDASDQAFWLPGGGLKMSFRPDFTAAMQMILIGVMCVGPVLMKPLPPRSELTGAFLGFLLFFVLPFFGIGIIALYKGGRELLNVKTLIIQNGELVIHSFGLEATRIPCSHLLDVGTDLTIASGSNLENTSWGLTLYCYDPDAAREAGMSLDEEDLQVLRREVLADDQSAPHSRVEPYAKALSPLTGLRDRSAERWVLEAADRQARR